MNWLQRLKNQKTLDTPPAKPTEPSCVGFAGTPFAHIQINEGVSKPEKVAPSLGKMGDYGLRADPVNPDFEGKPFGWAGSIFTRTFAIVRPAVPFPELAANDPATDADRQCWPHSTAMTGREIDTFTARLARITDKGVPTADGQHVADKMLLRDRQAGDWFSCLECQHLAGHAAGSWRCGNWQRANIALRARDAGLPADLVLQLQHCVGFTAALPNA